MPQIRIAKDRDQNEMVEKKPTRKTQTDGTKRKVLSDLNNRQLTNNAFRKPEKKSTENSKEKKQISSLQPKKAVSFPKELITSDILIPRDDRSKHTVSRTLLERLLLNPRKQLPTANSKSRFLALQNVRNKEPGLDFLEKKSGHSFEEIKNIDAKDKDTARVSQYVNDIYAYLMQLENSFIIQPNFLDKHPDLTPNMRAILAEWINEVHVEFNLTTEVYFLAISILDRYTQKINNIPRRSYQLIGTTALFIASKYEEIYPHKVAEFVYITDDAYTTQQIITMEFEILKSLDFRLNIPLSIHFIRRFFKAANISKTQYIACRYLLEIATVDFELSTKLPSEIAAATLYIILYIYNTRKQNDIWTPTLEFYTTYKADDLQSTVSKLAKVVLSAVEDDYDSTMQFVIKKYAKSVYDSVSTSEELTGGKIQELAMKN
ncbi:hypothetical protein PVAND_001215 [Polypedilum vanderplanki]|uniref:Uncharacterized protein n=1 Tax=Polypedilum vanderplanki TaxID=319348 RepID=A0A9J6BNJ2_POLVA|nr:hypothetical protein PVAND_001215 [Polypedilum vanderplanki]